VSFSGAELREMLDYDWRTGVFTWRIAVGRVRPGDRAGRINRSGYLQIGVGGQRYSAHRLVWLYVYGMWPIGDIDHINGDRSDNRLKNLRPATDAQNRANAKKQCGSSSGLKGVCFHKKLSKWQATITVDGKTKYLGIFATEQEAHEAYKKAAITAFGDFARAG
jgi:hypothetical protein